MAEPLASNVHAPDAKLQLLTFVIEFCNVQPDAEGNPANHIHCVWRDRTGDFDVPANP